MIRGYGWLLAIVLVSAAARAEVVKIPAGDPTGTSPVSKGPISSPVVQPVGPGEVDWSHSAIRATGMSVIDTALPAPQAFAMAVRGAQVDALRNLLETVKGVRVVAETRVEDLMTRNDYVYTRVDGIVKGAMLVGEPREQGGLMTVAMEIPLYGPGGLAQPVAEELRKALPPTRKGELTPEEQRAVAAASGVVFDLTGVNVQPQMFPTLVDSAGNILLDLVRYYGAGEEALDKLRYIQSLDDLLGDPELLSNPAVVKVVDLVKQGWVVAQKDIPKVSWLQKGLEVLLKLGKTVMMFL